MITINFNQSLAQSQDQLSDVLLKKMAEAVNDIVADTPDGVISASLVPDEEIQRLNRLYRKKDCVTDVLSFSYVDDSKSHGGLGDIVISLPQAQRQAHDDDLELELVDLLVHGTLHVLGFDHEQAEEAQEMFYLQDRIVAEVL